MRSSVNEMDRIIPEQRSRNFFDDELGIYHEEYFTEILTLERKRSERSGRPFLLMTLNFSGFQELRSRREAIAGTVAALSILDRETDIKGWYKHATVLGVVFMESDTVETHVLREKIDQSLRANLSDEQVNTVALSFYKYPDDGIFGLADSPSRAVFQPDWLDKNRPYTFALRTKRMLDVIGSIAGILLFLPFFVVLPLLIKLTSAGPVLFRQGRIGQRGRYFTFLKFRSMYTNNDPEVHRKFVHGLITRKTSGADHDAGPSQKIYKITNDPRVTPIGRFLRKTSLDELPQFFNVLKGEMSLIGPRPPIPYEVEKYDIWHRRRFMEVKPGITGLWQVQGRSSTSFDEMVRLDIEYAKNWSLWLDLKILLKTPFSVLRGKGAY